MTIQYADIGTISGQTLTAKLFLYQSDTEVTGNTYAVTERTNDKGTYRVSITRSTVLAAGTYKLTLFNGSTPVASGVRVFAGTDGEVAQTQADVAASQTGGGGGGSGTGARTVTITVNDGTTALQNAIVRMTEGVNTYTATTNASGVCAFNLDDATYTVGITKSGYSFFGTTLIVDGTETRTYSMTQIVPSAPSNPENSLLTITCRTPAGVVESGVVITVRKKTVAAGDQNNAYSGATMTDTSGVDGVTTFEVIRGATYQWKRGTSDSWTDIVIEDASNTDVTSIVGSRY